MQFTERGDSYTGEPSREIVHNGPGPALRVRSTGSGAAIEIVGKDGLARGIDGAPFGAPQVRPKRPVNTVVTGFQPGHGYFLSGSGSTTLIDDTSQFVNGSQCIRIITGGDGGTNFIKKNNIAPTIDATGKIPRVWVRFPTATDINNVSALAINLSSDNVVANFWGAEFGNLQNNPNWLTAQPGDWCAVTIPWGAFVQTGAPNRAALNSVWLKAIDQNSQPITVQFGGVELIPEPPNGVVSITFDDGFASQYTEGRKKLSQYRYPATAFIIRDLIDTASYMSLQNLKDLQDKHDWDICAHADTVASHNSANGFNDLSADDIERELSACRSWLKTNGFNGADHWALPKGFHNAATYAASRRLFKTTRTTYKAVRSETFPPADWNKLRVYYVLQTDTFANIQTAITRAVANKEWLILVFHEIVTSPSSATQCSITIFGQVVDELNTQGISVRTLADVAEHGI